MPTMVAVVGTGPGQPMPIQCDAPAPAACDEFDAALGKVSSLSIVYLRRDKTWAKAKVFNKCALVDADEKEICHIVVSMADSTTKKVVCAKASVQLPDGREVLTVTNDGWNSKGITAQAMDRGEAETVSWTPAGGCCLGFTDPAKAVLPEYTLTHSVAGAQNVVLTPNDAKNEPFNSFMKGVTAFALVTACVGTVFVGCVVRQPDLFAELFAWSEGGGTTTKAPLGVNMTVKGLLFQEQCVRNCDPTKGPPKVYSFDAAAPLQARKDMVAIIAYELGMIAITPNDGP